MGQSQRGAVTVLQEKHQENEWEKGEVLQRALRSEMITSVSNFIISSLASAHVMQQCILKDLLKIKVFACHLDEKPILVGNTELLRIYIRGKSFLYHQVFSVQFS